METTKFAATGGRPFGEIDGERSGAVRIDGVGAGGPSVREIGNDGSVDRHGVDLSESTDAIVGGHCNADLQSHRPGPNEFLTLDSEPVGSLDQPVVAGI